MKLCKFGRKAAMHLLLGAVFGLGIGMQPAFADHDIGVFEIDGNATDDPGPGADWASVLPLTGAAESFVVDEVPPLASETFFTGGGSKDDHDIGDWKTVDGDSANPDKDNITDAYAKAYSVDHDGDPSTPNHLVIYFGADRYANDGDAALGFWFFKGDVKPDGNRLSGQHTDDDILVQVDFVQGGTSSQIHIFRWAGDGSGEYGKPKHTLKELVFAEANGSTVCTAGDTACATTNEVGGIKAPWDYTPKSGPSGYFPSESMFEGAIDVTALVGDVCFSSFMAETRSSHSVTATLKDLALGDFNLCSIKAEKSCSTADINSDGTSITSTHTVTITNNGFGTVYDVGMRDDAVNSSDSCTITAVSGGTAASPALTLPYAIPNNTSFVEVANSLDKEQAVSVTLSCVSSKNPFKNSVSARAKASPTSASPDDVTASHSETDSDIAAACRKAFSPMVQVTKTCKKTVLDASNGFKPKVCADITVKNTSSPGEKLVNVNVTNTLNDGTTTHSLLVNGSLDPGQTYSTTDCYVPTAPDNDQTDPCLAGYTDNVDASGFGALSSSKATGKASDTCPLCGCSSSSSQ